MQKIFIRPDNIEKIIIRGTTEAGYVYSEYISEKKWFFGILVKSRSRAAGWVNKGYADDVSSKAFKLEDLVNGHSNYFFNGEKIMTKACITIIMENKDATYSHFSSNQEAEEFVDDLIKKYQLNLIVIKEL